MAERRKRRPEAYRALPIPDTTEEAWRFTDLRGFDPDVVRAASAPTEIATAMLDLDVAGSRRSPRTGSRSSRRPTASRFEPLPEDDARLYSLVGWDEKFAAHNAAVWKHGLLVLVPKGVVLEKPLYVRIARRRARRSGGCSSSPRRARASR